MVLEQQVDAGAVVDPVGREEGQARERLLSAPARAAVVDAQVHLRRRAASCCGARTHVSPITKMVRARRNDIAQLSPCTYCGQYLQIDAGQETELAALCYTPHRSST